MPSAREAACCVASGGASYRLSVSVVVDHGRFQASCPDKAKDLSGSVLAIDLEDVDTGSSWHAELAPQYVESVVARAGAPKQYAALCTALIEAIRSVDHGEIKGNSDANRKDATAISVLSASDLVRSLRFNN